MKKTLYVTVALLSLLIISIVPAFAIKPQNNIAGAQEYDWHLSGEYMKTGPWGLNDIEGSDTASKLVANQPNGAVELALTGVMKGLTPLKTYKVYVANGLTRNYYRYSLLGEWSHEGWIGANQQVPGAGYQHNWVVTQEDDSSFSGTGASIAGTPTWTFTGTKSGDGRTITMNIDYDGSTYWATLIGTIQEDRSIEGTWVDSNSKTGTWKTYSGEATFLGMIGTGYSGDLNGLPNAPVMTFETDEYGTGCWHINLRDDDFPTPNGNYQISIWINLGGTILISDNIDVIVGTGA